MDTRKFCNVAMLKPHETTWNAFTESYESLITDGESNVYDDRLDDLTEHLRDEICTVAEELGIAVEMSEFELQDGTLGRGRETSNVLSKKRKELLDASEVLTTVDPSPHVLAFITGRIQNSPIVRAIVGFTKERDYEDMMGFTRRTQSCVLCKGKDGPEFHHVPRIFPAHLSYQSKMRTSLCEALTYPNGRIFKSTGVSGVIIPTMLESSEGFGKFLR